MKYVGVVLYTIFMTTCLGYSQNKNSIFIEGLGNGLLYSVNYEKRYSAALNWGTRIGFSYLKGSEATVIVPLQLNYFIGQNNNWLIGLGVTSQFVENNAGTSLYVYPCASFMYVPQWRSKFFIRAGLTSTYLQRNRNDAYHISPDIFLIWPGFAVGYKI